MLDFLKKPIARKVVTIFVVAVLATGAELCFAAAQGSDLEYTRAEYVAADFTGWEVEERGGGNYYMLANNSYFQKSDFGGIAVQTMEIRLSRDASDNTEMVLYYSGTKGGVKGEFPTPIKKVSDGIYTATLDIESLDAVRIHPTERVRTVVRFDGIVINPTITMPSFSTARVILWGFLAALLYVAYNNAVGIIISRREKNGRKKIKLLYVKLPIWTSVYIIICATVLLAVFQATRMFSGVRGAEAVLLPVASVAFSALYFVAWLIVERIKKVELKLAVAVLTIGILFSFANAPLQAPDEYTHFMRAYTISRGQLGFDYNYKFPDDVYWLAETFPAEYNNTVSETGNGTVITSIEKYSEKENAPYTGRDIKTYIQVIIPYIPAAIGIAAARLFGGGALVCLYAARICNVIVFALCAYFALKWAARYRGALIAAVLLPMTLFMAASTSYDAMFLACTVLYFGIILKDRFIDRDLIVLLFVFAVIVSIKPIYLPMAFLVMLIPKESVKTKLPRWWCVAIAAAVALVFYEGTLMYASAFGNIPPVNKLAGVDVAAQASYIFANPLRYIMVLLVDAYTKVLYIDQFGIFGWLDVKAALTGLLTPIMFVVVGALYADTARTYKKTDKWLHALVAAAVYLIVVTGFYATWSTLGSTDILGVQARYFIPIIPCTVALLSSAMSPVLRFRFVINDRESMRDNVCVYICAAVSFVGAAELALNYFLM